jgi:tripartite-type tricarboxylate transporter receptor subunit TctC
MKIPRRRFLHLAASSAALPIASCIAWAQAYPTRPVHFIVAFAPGGANDIVARLIGQSLSERIGQPFIIENRAGAGSNIGTEVVVRAPPDGYMLLMVGAPNAINATLYEKLPFEFIRDIAPVASILNVPLVMEVNPSVPATTVREHRGALRGIARPADSGRLRAGLRGERVAWRRRSPEHPGPYRREAQ